MQNIFSRSPWERPPVVSLRGSNMGQRNEQGLGQYSWNNAGVQSQGGYYSWNGYGQDPAQRLLKNAEESMNAPAAQTPQQRLLKQAQQSMNPPAGECYTCVSGGDIRSGVDAATAASLKQQGFRCRKDECAQKGGYGSGSYTGFNGFGNAMNYGSQQASSMVSDINPSTYGATSVNAMMGRRYPVINR